MFADKTATENRDTIGSPGANYWSYHDCQREKESEREKKKEQVDRTIVSPDKRVKQKAVYAKTGGASHNSTGYRDSVNCGGTTLKGHGQRDHDCKVFIDPQRQL